MWRMKDGWGERGYLIKKHPVSYQSFHHYREFWTFHFNIYNFLPEIGLVGWCLFWWGCCDCSDGVKTNSTHCPKKHKMDYLHSRIIIWIQHWSIVHTCFCEHQTSQFLFKLSQKNLRLYSHIICIYIIMSSWK